MLTFTNGWTVTLIATWGEWSALVRKDGEYIATLVYKTYDWDEMKAYAEAVLHNMGMEKTY